MHVQDYLQLITNSEQQLSEAFNKVAGHHRDEPDIYYMCLMLGSWSDDHVKKIEPFLKKYAEHAKNTEEPERLSQTLFKEPRKGSLALLRDLHDLWLLTQEIEISWKVLLQAARALRDNELESACMELSHQTEKQSRWLLTRVKQAAPQILIVSE